MEKSEQPTETVPLPTVPLVVMNPCVHPAKKIRKLFPNRFGKINSKQRMNMSSFKTDFISVGTNNNNGKGKMYCEQMPILEACYSRCNYIHPVDRDELAQELNLNSEYLREWWQKRRQRSRRAGIEPKGPKFVVGPKRPSSCLQQSPYIPPIQQPIDVQHHYEWTNCENSYQMPQQQSGELDISAKFLETYLPHFDSNSFETFEMDDQMAPNCYTQNNEMQMVMEHNIADENLYGNLISPSSYCDDTTMSSNTYSPCTSDTSTQFTQIGHQAAVESADQPPLMNQCDDAGAEWIQPTAADNPHSYWHQLKSEFAECFAFDQFFS